MNTVWFPPSTAPAIGSEFVSVVNGHLALNGQRVAFFGVGFDFRSFLGPLTANGKSGTPTASAAAPILALLDNCVNAGVRSIRIHGLDSDKGYNLFCAGGGPQTTTRKLDSIAVSALGWFWRECTRRNIHITLTLHYVRQLTPADDPGGSPLFQEALTQSFPSNVPNGVTGCLWPWCVYDGALQALLMEHNHSLLRTPNPWTGIPFGDDPTLMAVTLHNEHSLPKDSPWGMPKHPLLNSAFIADITAWCATNGIVYPGKCGVAEHARYWIWRETQHLQALASDVRTLTKALVIAGGGYGNFPYSSMVAPCAVGDVGDFHFYSRYSAGDPNGFLNDPIVGSGQTAPVRSRFAGVAGGSSSKSRPQFCTEFAPVGQSPVALDPDAERAQVMKAVVEASVAQDIDAIYLYTYRHSPIFPDGSPYQKPDVYDLAFDPILMRGLPSHAAWFNDVSLRPTTAQTVPLPSATLYSATGPLTDPALYQIPAGTKVQMQVTP